MLPTDMADGFKLTWEHDLYVSRGTEQPTNILYSSSKDSSPDFSLTYPYTTWY